ncbi:DUF6588 family protein [candidate division KSB1 bacterium]
MYNAFILVVAAAVLNPSPGVVAQDLDLNKYESEAFSNLAVVTGRVLGSGFYHTGAIHEFGGFDVGVKAMIAYIADDYKIGPMSDTKMVSMPVFQANVGLFDKFEIGGRFFSFKYGNSSKEEVTLSSGVVKYNLLSGLGLPDITVISAFSRISGVTDFSLKTYSFGGVIGYGVPIVTFYAGGTYNIVKMDVELESGGLYPSRFSQSYTKYVNHWTAGLSLGVAPFAKLNAEFNLGEVNGVTAGLIFSVY